MKKTQISQSNPDADELRPEYHFDYRDAKPNRFAGRMDKNRVVVVLDDDVSKVFTSSQKVNDVLRALITTMPPVNGEKTSV